MFLMFFLESMSVPARSGEVSVPKNRNLECFSFRHFFPAKSFLTFYRLSENRSRPTLVWQNQAKAFEVSVFLRKTETSNRLRPKYLAVSEPLYASSTCQVFFYDFKFRITAKSLTRSLRPLTLILSRNRMAYREGSVNCL